MAVVTLLLVGGITMAVSGAAHNERLPAASSPPVPSAVADQADPSMQMITITDSGITPAVVQVSAGQQVMLMIVNRGIAQHSLTSAIPATRLSIDGSQVATGVSATVAPGEEADVVFVATKTGSFAVTVDAAT
jgi:hypothetical protein